MLRRDLNWFGHISSSGGISNAGAQCMSGQGQCDGSTGVATGQSEEELSVLPHNTEARYTAKQPAATEARYTAKQPAAAVIPHLDRRSAGQVAANHTGTSGHQESRSCCISRGPRELKRLSGTLRRSWTCFYLVSQCPRSPRSGADVGRQVLAGEGGAGGDEVGGCALEDDPAAV